MWKGFRHWENITFLTGYLNDCLLMLWRLDWKRWNDTTKGKCDTSSLLQPLLTRKGWQSLWAGFYLYLECFIFSKFPPPLLPALYHTSCLLLISYSLPSFCTCYSFFPGMVFSPSSVMLSCNIHHNCNFALICASIMY